MSTPILTFKSDSSGWRVDLDQFVATRALIQANSGGGKSRMLRYLLEQTHGKIQQIILDPEGEFASLREKFPYLLAGHEGDVPATPKTAKVLARRLLELNASAVIDLYDLKLDERRRFVRLFLEELMHVPRSLWRPLLVPIDEAHVFCPERGQGEAESSQAVITLCTQGRKRGFSAVLATQRISKLHKDAAAELLNVLIGRTGLDVDIKRAGDALGFDKETRLSLRDLEPGEFYAFGPAISRSVLKVRSGAIQTSHPQPGKIAPPAPPPPAAVQKMVAQLHDLAKQADEEARTIADFEQQLAAAKSRIRQLERNAPVFSIDEEKFKKQIDVALANRNREHAAVERELRGRIAALGQRITRIGATARHLVGLTDVEPEEIPEANGNGAVAHFVKFKPPVSARDEVRVTVTPDNRPPRQDRNPTAGALPKGEYAVLTAACQYPAGVTRQQLSILTGYKRSSRDQYIQRLREKGLVEPSGELVIAQPGAREMIVDFEPLPTGDALRQFWYDRLPAGERAVLAYVCEAYPGWVARDDISNETGYKRSSRDQYIQRLSARQIVETGTQGVRAPDFLFTPLK